jgi:hypothetical protein
MSGHTNVEVGIATTYPGALETTLANIMTRGVYYYESPIEDGRGEFTLRRISKLLHLLSLPDL